MSMLVMVFRSLLGRYRPMLPAIDLSPLWAMRRPLLIGRLLRVFLGGVVSFGLVRSAHALPLKLFHLRPHPGIGHGLCASAAAGCRMLSIDPPCGP